MGVGPVQSGDAYGSGYGGGFVAGRISPHDPLSGSPQMRIDAAASGVLPARIVAWCLDAVFITLIAGAVALLVGALTLASFGLLHGLFALLGMIPFLYSWLFVGSSLAATPGQAICGLGLRDNRTLGRPGMAAALLWTIGYAVTMILGAFLLLFALITKRHRTLHDLVSGLVMVRVGTLPGATFGAA